MICNDNHRRTLFLLLPLPAGRRRIKESSFTFLCFGDWIKSHGLKKSSQSKHAAAAPQFCDPAPQRRSGGSSITMTMRLCNIRVENDHLWVTAGGEEKCATKNKKIKSSQLATRSLSPNNSPSFAQCQIWKQSMNFSTKAVDKNNGFEGVFLKQ